MTDMKNLDKDSLFTEYLAYERKIRTLDDLRELAVFGNFISSLTALMMLKLSLECNFSHQDCIEGIDMLAQDAKTLVPKTLASKPKTN